MPYKEYGKQKEAWRNHYANNKDYYYQRNKNTRQAKREWLISLKENKPCSVCNKIYHHAAMDWHHKDPTEKEFNIGIAVQRGLGKERIIKEIEKCELVCSNCHRALEYELLNQP